MICLFRQLKTFSKTFWIKMVNSFSQLSACMFSGQTYHVPGPDMQNVKMLTKAGILKPKFHPKSYRLCLYKVFYKLYFTAASLIFQITQVYTPLIDGSLKETVNILRSQSNSRSQDADYSDTCSKDNFKLLLQNWPEGQSKAIEKKDHDIVAGHSWKFQYN